MQLDNVTSTPRPDTLSAASTGAGPAATVAAAPTTAGRGQRLGLADSRVLYLL